MYFFHINLAADILRYKDVIYFTIQFPWPSAKSSPVDGVISLCKNCIKITTSCSASAITEKRCNIKFVTMYRHM